MVDTLRLMSRAVWFIYGILVAWLVMMPWAYAETVSATPTAMTPYNWLGSTGGQYASAAAFCANVSSGTGTVTAGSDAYHVTCHTEAAGGYTWSAYQRGYCSATPGTIVVMQGGTPCFSCPSSAWTLNGSVCTYGGPDCAAKKGTSAGSGYYAGGTSASVRPPFIPLACADGCEVVFGGYWPGGKDAGGQFYAKGSFTFDGFVCSPGAPGVPSVNGAPPVACPAGQCPGTVNGVAVCVSCSSSGTPQVSSSGKTTTDSSGITTSETTTSTAGADGTVSTESTSASGAQGTGVTSGARSDSKTTEDAPSFCAENPTSAVCQTNSASGGVDCSSPPVSEGDAIAGAILVQTWKTRCALDPQPTALSQMGDQVIAGNDPVSSTVPKPANGVTTDLGAVITQAKGSRVLTESCVPSFSIPFRGSSVSVDMSGFCSSLQIAGNVLVALAALAAVGIVGRG